MRVADDRRKRQGPSDLKGKLPVATIGEMAREVPPAGPRVCDAQSKGDAQTSSARRVRFYSKFDGSVSYYFPRIEAVLGHMPETGAFASITDAIEAFHINQFFVNECVSVQWDSEKLERYEQLCKTFKPRIAKTFAVIQEGNLADIASHIEREYIETFWLLFDQLNMQQRIGEEAFGQALDSLSRQHLLAVLSCRHLVAHYGTVIRQYLLKHPGTDECVVRILLEAPEGGEILWVLPEVFDATDSETVLSRYVDSGNPGIALLDLIASGRGRHQEIVASPKTRLAARRRSLARQEKLRNSPEMIHADVSVKIAIAPIQDGSVKRSVRNGNNLEITIDSEWLSRYRDDETVLNNAIHVFGFVDEQCRWQGISNPRIKYFLDYFGTHGYREYACTTDFSFRSMLQNRLFIAYYSELRQAGIRLEEVLSRFFSDYLKNKFGVSGFAFRAPQEMSSPLEQCRHLVVEIESVLRQFQAFCRDGEIDLALIAEDASHLKIADVVSLIGRKYVYPKGDQIELAMKLLFSDQSVLLGVEGKLGVHGCRSFAELMDDRCVLLRLSDFWEYQRAYAEWLVSNDILKEGGDGRLLLDHVATEILRQLYQDQVICVNYCSGKSSLLRRIEQWKDRGWVDEEASLLSRPEQRYFNYVFNKAQYDNGLDIRNKYAHGTPYQDEDLIRRDYAVALHVLLLIVIKINEEFCLAHPVSEGEALFQVDGNDLLRGYLARHLRSRVSESAKEGQ